MIAKQFLLSAAKDQKALTSSKLQFIDATVKSELFVHKGNYLYRDAGSSLVSLLSYSTTLTTTLIQPTQLQARVVQRPDNAIHRINHYPADSVVCFVNIYPLDSDLSGG